MRITGKTRIMFILADAVDHIMGSDVLNRAFDAMGLDVAVSPLSVAPEHLGQMLDILRRTKNVVGFGVTIPHKIAVLGLVDELTDAARAIGAVNFVRRNADGRLIGHNIDGEGFIAGLAARGITVRGARVLQIGAGGVGRAIAFALADAGAAFIDLINRDGTKAKALGDAVAARVPGIRFATHATEATLPATPFDLVVNATSLGMYDGDALPVSPERLSAGSTFAEVIMSPPRTPLLAEAEKRGAKAVPGLGMMEPQPRLVARFLGLAEG